MSGSLLSAALGSQVGGPLPFGVTWVPAATAREFVGDEGSGDPAHDVAAAAVRLGARFAFVPAGEPWAARCAGALRAAGLAVAWAVPGPLGTVAAERGWAAVIRASAASPDDLAAPLSRALHDAAVLVRAGARAGASFAVVADDLAAGEGWLVSPDFALSAVVPCLTHLAGEAHAVGLPCVFHSDGDVRVLYGALKGSGFEGVHIAPGGRRGPAEAAEAAADAGLLAFGGIRSAGLGGAGGEVAKDLLELRARGRLVACDDGGITEPAQLLALAQVFTTMTSRETV